jgi:hypothetical protein
MITHRRWRASTRPQSAQPYHRSITGHSTAGPPWRNPNTAPPLSSHSTAGCRREEGMLAEGAGCRPCTCSSSSGLISGGCSSCCCCCCCCCWIETGDSGGPCGRDSSANGSPSFLCCCDSDGGSDDCTWAIDTPDELCALETSSSFPERLRLEAGERVTTLELPVRRRESVWWVLMLPRSRPQELSLDVSTRSIGSGWAVQAASPPPTDREETGPSCAACNQVAREVSPSPPTPPLLLLLHV